MQKNETVGKGTDIIKLVVALFAIILSIIGFYIYSDQSTLARVGGLVLGSAIAIAILLQTMLGRNIWGFFRNAELEVRKVVWSTPQETMQTTILIIIVVILVAIVLWLLDMFLGWTIGSLMDGRRS